MYAYYAEMDATVASIFTTGRTGGHRHDWEHVIVWTLNDEVHYVSWSAHGGYTTEHHSEVRFFEGSHPKIVAHHGWGSLGSGSLRKTTADDDKIESPWGHWFKSWLLSRETMNDAVGHKLMTADWGYGHLDLKDERFANALNKSMPWIARNEHFNPFDEWPKPDFSLGPG